MTTVTGNDYYPREPGKAKNHYNINGNGKLGTVIIYFIYLLQLFYIKWHVYSKCVNTGKCWSIMFDKSMAGYIWGYMY